MPPTLLCEQALLHKALHFGTVPAILMLLLLGSAKQNIARSQELQSAEPHTQEVVVAIDNAWEKAEESGDTAYIDALLLPDYRSVNVDGSSNDKAAILALARKNASSTKRATADEEWRVTHPYLMSVKIIGDTAVLTFTLNKPDSPRRIMSCDIFVYREGHWRALYSQHSTAAA
jgi:hypothetical protein